MFLSNNEGNFLALKNNLELLNLDLGSKALSAAIKDNVLAVTTIQNEIFVIDTNAKQIRLRHQEKSVITTTKQVAVPLFYKNQIIFGTLNSKIILVENNHIVKSLVIDSDDYFVNVDFLALVGTKIIAHAGSRLASFNENSTKTAELNAKNIVATKNHIFITTDDSKIIKLDEDLKELKSLRLPFARFSGIVFNKGLFVLEASGFLLRLDEDLSLLHSYSLTDEIEDSFLLTPTKLYYSRKLINLETLPR